MSILGNTSEKDNLEGLREKKRAIIYRLQLSMQRNGEGQNGIVLKYINTRNTSDVETKVRTVKTGCKCDPNLWLCKSCHTYHVTNIDH